MLSGFSHLFICVGYILATSTDISSQNHPLILKFIVNGHSF